MSDPGEPLRLHVTIARARDGERDYIQIMSDDAMSVNVVLVADEIKVQDAREAAEPGKPESPALPLGHEYMNSYRLSLECAICGQPESAHKPAREKEGA